MATQQAADEAAQQSAEKLSIYLRVQRKKRGMSIREVARRAGLNPGNVLGIENGRTVHSPRPETIRGLARALEVPEADLLGCLGYQVTPPTLRGYLCARYQHLAGETINEVCGYVERMVARDEDRDSEGDGDGGGKGLHGEEPDDESLGNLK